MLFTEPLYLFLFLPAVSLSFYLAFARLGRTSALFVVFVASLIFYGRLGRWCLALMVASTVANFLVTVALLRTPDRHRRRRILLHTVGQAYNFATLAWFKLASYQIPAGDASGALPMMDVAIPVGISFYTFQRAILLVDAYERNASVSAYLSDLLGARAILRAFIHYGAFVCFFPQITLGPIVYLREFQPQVQSPHFGRLRLRDLEVALFLLTAGLFKKVVVADHVGAVADRVFMAVDAGFLLSSPNAWAGALAYYAQLYFDFSGYSDMALGAARMIGIRLPINFDSPLKAVGIADFYRRWHVTLTRAIARFLYVPLSMWGARLTARGALPRSLARPLACWLPLIINFEVIGMWHGVAGTFLLFGLVHGLWYVLESEVRASEIWKWWRRSAPTMIRAALGRLLFLVPAVLSFALFRSHSVLGFWQLLGSMTSRHTGSNPSLVLWEDWAVIAGSLVIAWMLPNCYELARHYRPGIAADGNRSYTWQRLRLAWRPNLLWSAATVAAFLWCMYFLEQPPPFIYLGF